jgi:DNA invertase Pin-like site-specific DNA recombinase
MKYGYARCSTNDKLQDITRQHRELIEMGVDKKNIFSEYESGTKADRPQFIKLKETVKEKDTIICTEASRITRSIKQLLEFLEFAKEKHLKLILGTFIVDFSTSVPDPMTLATVQLMGVFAELERNIISERVKSGMENAREQGKQIGRKIVTVNDIPEKFIKYYQLYVDKRITKEILAELSGISYPTCLKYCKMLKENE